MSSKYKFRDQNTAYFISFAVINWIDLFIRNEYKNILLDSWRYCAVHKSLDIYAWCIMTSHVHMIIGSESKPLETIVCDMKTFTSKALRNAVVTNQSESRKEWMLQMMYQNNSFRLWQSGTHPIALTTPALFQQKIDYIHNNPVSAGFVDDPEDFLYSSARDFSGRTGLIEIKRF